MAGTTSFGPGTENAFGGVAQAFGESVPIVVLPGGYPRTMSAVPPNFSAYLNFQHITKSAEQVTVAAAVPDALRRAFTQVKNGRPRPVLVEIPKDIFDEELSPAQGKNLEEATGTRVVDRADAIVNLSGSGIIHWPPTGRYRRELLASRVDTTTTLARAVAASPTARPARPGGRRTR